MMSGKGGMEIIQEKAKYASDQINLAATTAEQRLKYVFFNFHSICAYHILPQSSTLCTLRMDYRVEQKKVYTC